MTLGQIRAAVRRRIQEVTPYLYTDGELKTIINTGLEEIHSRVRETQPEAVVHTAVLDTIAGFTLYPKPIGMIQELELSLLTPTASGYLPMDRRTHEWQRSVEQQNRRTGYSSPPAQSLHQYSHFGRFFRIYPATPTSVVSGLLCTYVPTLTMDEDTDVPQLPYFLHQAVVLRAKLIVCEEVGEDAGADEARLEKILARIPTDYSIKGGDNDAFEADYGKS